MARSSLELSEALPGREDLAEQLSVLLTLSGLSSKKLIPLESRKEEEEVDKNMGRGEMRKRGRDAGRREPKMKRENNGKKWLLTNVGEAS